MVNRVSFELTKIGLIRALSSGLSADKRCKVINDTTGEVVGFIAPVAGGWEWAVKDYCGSVEDTREEALAALAHEYADLLDCRAEDAAYAAMVEALPEPIRSSKRAADAAAFEYEREKMRNWLRPDALEAARIRALETAHAFNMAAFMASAA